MNQPRHPKKNSANPENLETISEEVVDTAASSEVLSDRYCSWCLQKTNHALQEPHRVRRNVYQCQSCHHYTLPCRLCDNMSKGTENGSLQKIMRWDNERCAVHDGTIQIANPLRLKDITDYQTLLDTDPSNANIEAIIGKYLLSEYFDDDERFDIIQLSKHNSQNQRNIDKEPIHKVIVINGFLKERDKIFQDWLHAYAEIPDNTVLYGLTWASKTMGDFAKSFLSPKLTNIASKKLLLAQIAYSAITNPWHVSMKKAKDAGVLLGNILLHTHGEPFTLIAHSLGCRVIYYALELLKYHPHIKVKDLILLGGAVGNDTKDWEEIANYISGNIYNCHSDNDDVLHKLYNAATLKLSKPIGYYPIQSHQPNIINIDCTDIISGHDQWKDQYLKIYHRIAEYNPKLSHFE